MKTVHAILNKDGTYELAEPLEFSSDRQHVLVTLVGKDDEASVGGVSDTALASEAALARDWLRTEEDEAWKHLQRDKS